MPPGALERRGNLLEFDRAGREFFRAAKVACRQVTRHQFCADVVVFRIQIVGELECGERVGRLALVFVLGRDIGVFTYRRGCLADLGGRARRAEPRLQIIGIERADANTDFRRTLFVAARSALVGDRLVKGLGVGNASLLGGHVGRLHERVLVIGFDLEDLFIERASLGVKALLSEVIGNARVLGDALVDGIGANVEIAECVRAVPVARLLFDNPDIFGNGRVDAALTQGFFGVFESTFSIERSHQQFSLSSFDSVGEPSTASSVGVTRRRPCDRCPETRLGAPLRVRKNRRGELEGFKRIKQRRRSKRAPMDGRIPVTRHRGEVIGGRVSLVTIKSVTRIIRVQAVHKTITGHFCHD